MPKITWLGDAECLWNDVTFPVGVPIDIDDPYMLGKAKHSPYFKVETDVSFFDDPPEVHGLMPETWTNTPDNALKRKRGRPPKVRTNGE